jgi:hypothetical protein
LGAAVKRGPPLEKASLSLENARLGSHGYCALGSNRGPFDPLKSPRLIQETKSIVATNVIFIRRGDLNRSCSTFVNPQESELFTPQRSPSCFSISSRSQETGN